MVIIQPIIATSIVAILFPYFFHSTILQLLFLIDLLVHIS
jgi:hypothetical protein